MRIEANSDDDGLRRFVAELETYGVTVRERDRRVSRDGMIGEHAITIVLSVAGGVASDLLSDAIRVAAAKTNTKIRRWWTEPETNERRADELSSVGEEE